VTLKTQFKVFSPGGIVLLLGILISQVDFISQRMSTIILLYPNIVFLGGILLGWRFNRSRLVFAIIVIAIAARTLYYLNPPLSDSPDQQLVFNLVSFLFPLNLMILIVIKERGILTLRGFARLGLILLQPLFILALFYVEGEGFLKFVNSEFSKISFISKTGLSQFAFLAYFVSLGVVTLFTFFTKRPDIINGGFLWALVCSFLALTFFETKFMTTYYFSTAGLILVVSVLESSYSMAYKDELTGLPARRALEEAFLKLPNKYTIAMVDIDFFKKFNDRYGHDVGDQVLRMVAGQLSKVGGGGKAFRYGGEEFCLLFANRGVADSKGFAEKTRKTIANTDFAIRSRRRPRKKPEDLEKYKKDFKKVHIRVSIGIAEKTGDFDQPHDVLKAADKALYRAKRDGRNCTRISNRSS
jgi:diguanylate cyclase (GGDEF)-like protein